MTAAALKNLIADAEAASARIDALFAEAASSVRATVSKDG